MDGLSKQGVCKQCKQEVEWDYNPSTEPHVSSPERLVTRRIVNVIVNDRAGVNAESVGNMARN